MSDSPVIFKRSKSKPSQRRQKSQDADDAAETPEHTSNGAESPLTLVSKLKNKNKKAKATSRLSFGGDNEGEGEVFQVKKSSLSQKLVIRRPNEENQELNPESRLVREDDELGKRGGEVFQVKKSNLSQKLDIRRADENQGPHPESRLVREDDELGEGDDEFAEYTSAQEMIPLGRKSRKVAAAKQREERQELIADAEEDDDEMIEWEQEQMRRGGQFSGEDIDREPAKQVYKAAPIPPPTPIPTLGPSIARFTQSLTALTISHSSNTAALTSLAEEREQLDERETELREMVAKVEEKRSWFVDFKEWVEAVATFLDEKYPLLEKLEDEHISIITERTDMILKRRRADDEDDISLFLGNLRTPPQPDGPMEELDELGRIVPRANPAVLRKERMSARATRRLRRKAVSQKQDEEGFSTDSSLSPSDGADYATAINRILTSAQNILSDVRSKEFKDARLGLGKRFGDWRRKYEDIYIGAWGGLGLVGAWDFWVRLEIVGWNPIEDTNTSLDRFKWYSSLYEYSRPRAEGDENDPELGPDGDLVSAMISTVIVPRLCKIIEGGFNAYSSKSLRKVISIAEQVEASVEKDSQKFQILLRSVYTVFANEVENVQSSLMPYLALNKPPFDPESIPARQRFLARRIKLVQNIICWRKYTSERFGIGELASKLVDRCIVPVAEGGWEVGGKSCVQKVLSILPHELVPHSLRGHVR